jgi:hypothetical protein
MTIHEKINIRSNYFGLCYFPVTLAQMHIYNGPKLANVVRTNWYNHFGSVPYFVIGTQVLWNVLESKKFTNFEE